MSALKKYKKVFIWVGGVILALLILIGGAALYLDAKWKPLLSAKIKEGVKEGSNGLYQLSFKDIHLSLLSGNVVLDSLVLSPDTAVFNQLKAVKKAPTHLFRIKLAHLKLSRIGILTAYFKKKIKINSIVLDHPSIDMVFNKVPKQKDTLKDERTLYEQISKSLRSIRVGSIRVVDANFDYYNGSKKLNAVQHLTINVRDVLIDSLAQYDTTRVFHAKDIGFEMNGYKSLTADKMYTLKVDTLQGSISKRTLTVKGLKMIPMYPDLTFSRKYSSQKDRYDLSFQQILLSGVDFITLNNEGDLRARKVLLGPAKVAIFMNRELPPPAFDKGRNYPHRALKRLPISTLIDTLALNNIDIAYTEFNPKTKERGTLRLESLKGKILNVTNDSARLIKHNHAYADLSTLIMGKGKMEVNIDFNLTDPAAGFTYAGHIAAFDMKALNPLSKSLGLIEIKSGNVSKVDFKINANEKRASGNLQFYYTDLKVNLLKDGEDGKAKEKKGLLSFLANTILIKNDNPTKGEAPRSVNVAYERLPQASFFNLMWKTIFVGIRETVGIGAVPMKPMQEPKKRKK